MEKATDTPAPCPELGKIRRILEAFDAAFVERERQARLVLLAMLAGHHALVLGPPGTAKSLLARGLARVLVRDDGADATTFEYLLTRFTHPDELFGPVSLEGLKREDYRRVTDGYLPRAEVAFIDEIFKANSAILNSLLGLVNERVYHCGRHREPVPLVAMIGASNEPPDPEGGLAALYDRFLVRLTVEPIADPDRFLSVALGELSPLDLDAGSRLTLGELVALRRRAGEVTLTAAARRGVLALREALIELGVAGSDRRWRQALELLRMAAWTSGRQEVSLCDLTLLGAVFGDPIEDGGRVRQALKRALEVAALPAELAGLEARWSGLGAEHPADGEAAGLASLRARRIAAVDMIAADAAALEGTLAHERDAMLADAKASPWFAGDEGADLLARLATAYLSARAGVERLTRAASRHRAELTGMELTGEALDRLRRAQTSSHLERRHDSPDDVALWLAPPGRDPDEWVPLSHEGWLLSESAPRIAGRLQRRLLDEALANRLPLDEVPQWHERVERLVLDDIAVSSLLDEWPALKLFLESRAVAPGSRAQAALRALSEWLRGAGVPRLPPPPELG